MIPYPASKYLQPAAFLVNSCEAPQRLSHMRRNPMHNPAGDPRVGSNRHAGCEAGRFSGHGNIFWESLASSKDFVVGVEDGNSFRFVKPRKLRGTVRRYLPHILTGGCRNYRIAGAWRLGVFGIERYVAGVWRSSDGTCVARWWSSGWL
jgi:hypothetical protein